MQYDDMDGLEYGDYGMDGFTDGMADWAKQALMAGAAGAGALALTSMGINYATDKIEFLQRKDKETGETDEDMQKVQNGAIQLGLGIVLGKLVDEYSNQPAASMGVTVGLGVVGVMNIINGFLKKDKAINFAGMEDESLLSGYDDEDYDDYDDGMEALAALETTGVSSSPGAFQGLGDPTVTPEALMGTVVQQESLGGYAPYLS